MLGGHARVDAMTLARRGVEFGCEIVLIAVGYPLSQRQARLVEATVGLVDRMQLSLDAILVASEQDVPLYLEPGDQVEVLASGLERRRLSRVVDQAIGGARGR